MSFKKLHLGCGQRKLIGYTNIDIIESQSVDLVQDARILSSIPENSVELIYASHILEHFALYEVPWVIKRWFSLLHHGGVLRMSVPNFESIIEVYKKTNNILTVLGPLYGRGTKSPGITEPLHMCAYTEKFLTALLLGAGFSNVSLWSPDEIFVNENIGFDDYSQAYFPHMDKTGIPISLNLEARK